MQALDQVAPGEAASENLRTMKYVLAKGTQFNVAGLNIRMFWNQVGVLLACRDIAYIEPLTSA